MIALLVGIFIYISICVLLIRKYSYFQSNRLLFVESELQKEGYKFDFDNPQSGIFRNAGHKYAVLYGVPIFLVLMFISYKLILLYPLLIIPKGSELLTINSSLIIAIFPLFVYVLCLEAIIVLSIKTPKAAAISEGLFSEITRDGLWKKALISILMTHIFLFPILFLGINTYGYYNEDGFYYNRFFQIEGEFVKYEEIEKIEVGFHRNDHETLSMYYYIYYSDGEVLNIETNNIRKYMSYEFHLILEKHYQGDFIVSEVNIGDVKYLNQLSDSRREKLEYLLEGIHSPDTP